MAIQLTVNITIENGTRLVVGRPESIDDDANVMLVPVTLRSAAASDYELGAWSVVIRNGLSDQLIRNASPVQGQSIRDAKITQVTRGVSTPTGFTTALAAWAGGGASPGGKRAALEVALRSLGVIDQTSLAGS